jgi:methyltransferase (TIGR00027 family)
MTSEREPDHTAVRVALWRALHVELDAAPLVLADTLGRDLVAPPDDWRARPDMDPVNTRTARASIVARARFIEDLVVERGVAQYVLLGAGLDTFAQRRAAEVAAAHLRVFEVDQPGTQAWKRGRLAALGLPVPTLVPVNFEVDSWWTQLIAAGFDPARPAVVASTGVTMYLTKETNAATLRQLAALAPGSTLAMSYLVPHAQTAPAELPWRKIAEEGARRSGTPFLSFFDGSELVALALAAGFRAAHVVSGDDLAQRYYAGRSDGLRPSTSEQVLVATT